MKKDKLSKAETRLLLKEIQAVLDQVLEIGKNENKKTGFCIGNTTKKIQRDYFLTPIRNAAACVSGSIIIDRVIIAEVLIKAIDGKVDYIFVDTEKKISPSRYSPHDAGNVERTARSFATKSYVLTYKGNGLIVDAIDCFLAQKTGFDERGIGGKKIAIVGAGNIGFKLALKLTERGANVFLARRDAKKLAALVRTLNTIKPEGTLAYARGTTHIARAVSGADVVIGLTPGTGDITAAMVSKLNPKALLIDGGKGSFSAAAIQEAERREIPVWRSSIAASFEGQIAMLLKMQSHLQRFTGRRELCGIPIVSAGLIGKKGEFVVDDLDHPAAIYGVADGCGDFIRSLSAGQKAQYAKLAETIQKSEPLLRA